MWSQFSPVVTVVTCIHNCYMCSKLSHMVTIVTSSQNCHILLQMWHVFTIVTCDHNCHMWSQLSHVITTVTCDHNCQLWSQVSHVVTFVTCDLNCHICSQLSHTLSLLLSKFPSLLLLLLPSPRICWPYGSFVAVGKNIYKCYWKKTHFLTWPTWPWPIFYSELEQIRDHFPCQQSPYFLVKVVSHLLYVKVKQN